MKALNRIIICFFITAVICSADITALASPDINTWEDAVSTVFIDNGEISNSNILRAALKIRPDSQSNRLEMLFMLTMNQYQGAERTGIVFNLNSLGTVVMKGNGTLSYNEETYSLSVQTFDDESGTVHYYAVLGVKDGYGEVLDMQVAFYDSQGVRSNTCRAQIRLDGSDDAVKTETNSQTKTITSQTQNSQNSVTEGNILTKTAKDNSYPQATAADGNGETKPQTAEYDEAEETKSVRQESETILSDGKRKIVIIVFLSAAVGCGASAPFLIRYVHEKKY